MPPDDGVRLNDDQRRAPIWPQPREPNPNYAIPRPQLRPLGSATMDGQLLSQRKILNYQSGPTCPERPYAEQTLDCKLNHDALHESIHRSGTCTLYTDCSENHASNAWL